MECWQCADVVCCRASRGLFSKWGLQYLATTKLAKYTKNVRSDEDKHHSEFIPVQSYPHLALKMVSSPLCDFLTTLTLDCLGWR